MNKNKKGFSLIELLVVVLIIGILAAVAVPKYQVMTKVSKIKALYPQMRALVEARARYYQANRVFTTDMSALDVQIPYNRKSGNTYYTDWGLFRLYSPAQCGDAYGGCIIYSVDNTDVGIVFQLGHRKASYGSQNQGICYAPKNDSQANKICKQLGATRKSSNSTQYIYLFY